ncbi:16S rRNA (adenine1518-N6/adenine1519-N6)-dimethyltransferase [Methanococcus voltae]|uniref:Probable ribosomal RNA small subunit methyltransferase A n=1 Tax=Methanococcus voltae TaxID=2188 RepID=A0A8J7UUL6_METVO|nr:16S rRNA (adenine(1518)-N(6)/adenine(1519)-N(6))-dimethyltransferase RsmA [Methanococcus voltae]MBP2201466.1 16S rRNA (adenine1518-N6/adenine1519-N6)-dimethyltransferase [Methanococcus voltae]
MNSNSHKNSKKLGQCFLKDKNFVKKAISSANLNDEDIVLEIGLGEGVLTKELAKVAKKVYVIELDKRLEIFAKEVVKEYPNVTIIWEDALKVDLDSLDFNKIVANLPYQISSPITFKFLERKKGFDLAVLMYQYEFAKRMVGKEDTKEYSRLSVAVQYHADVKMVCKVPPTAFSPKPKVDSAIVKLIKKNPDYQVLDEKTFKNLLKALFQHRNKTVGKALVNSAHELNLTREHVKEFIEAYSEEFDFKERVFKLPGFEIGELSNLLNKFISKLPKLEQ